MKRSRLSVLFLSLILLCSLALTACTQSQASQTNAGSSAQPEASGQPTETADDGEVQKLTSGEITVYTALEDEQVTDYLAAFNKEYPDIKVNIVRDSTGVVTAKLLAEADNIQADVVWGTAASSLLVLEDKNLLAPYAPEGADRVLAKFKSDKKVPTWVGIDVWETAFVVNTDECKRLGIEVPTSYEDLLKPEYEGLIVMSNPSSSGTGYLTVNGILQLKGEQAGWEYLRQLHNNVAQYVHSGSKPSKMAASGECVIGISFGYAGIQRVEEGAPVEVVFPEEGSGWDLEANALMNKKEINGAALTFLDWAISDEAMDLYKQNYPIISTGKGGTYKGFESMNPIDQLLNIDLTTAAMNRESVLAQWTSEFDAKSAPKT